MNLHFLPINAIAQKKNVHLEWVVVKHGCDMNVWRARETGDDGDVFAE